MVKALTRLQLLGLVDSGEDLLRSIVDRHDILLGKLTREIGLGNVLYGIEDPTQKVQILVATATADLTLTQAAQSIIGDGDGSKVRIILPTVGDWLVEATCDFNMTAAGSGISIGSLFVNDSGAAESARAYYIPDAAASERATVVQRWKVTTTAINTPVELKAEKENSGGTALVQFNNTRLTAIGGAGSADIRLSNHGLLEGLSDIGDHLYAILLDGTRAFTGDQSMGGNKLTDWAITVVAKTGAYTATSSDHVILCNASGGAFTITLPAASGVLGIIYHIKKTDSSGNAVTVDGNGSETIDGATTASLTAQYESIMIVCDGSNWHII